MVRLSRRETLVGAGAGAAVLAAPWALGAAPQYDDPEAMYAALKSAPHQEIAIGSRTIRVAFADGAPGLNRAFVLDWVRRGATAIGSYYGRYPVREHGLLVIAEAGDRVGHATTYGYRGAATRIHVGVDADVAAFDRDWVLIHEMVHTALPNLPRRALWLQEGNATYVEPVARARVGQLAIEDVWGQFIDGMPRGLAAAAEGGMDGTDRWGRLYWGGATFWLMAEVAIYEQSGGRRALIDALRAVNRSSGGNVVKEMPEDVMTAADAVLGIPVMAGLYRQFASGSVDVELDKLFGRLGVARQDGRILFSDTAPLAPLRRRMTAAAPNAS